MGFMEITCENIGPIVIYLYATEMGSVTLPMPDDSYAVTRGGTFGDGYGLTPDGEGVLRVEADWIVDGIRVLAVAFKGIAGSLPGPKTVGVAMVDGNSRWSRIRFNKTGYRGLYSQVVNMYTAMGAQLIRRAR